MSAQQLHEARSSETASEAFQPMSVRLAGAVAGPALSVAAECATEMGYRLSGLLPGRPYCLSAPEDRDETVREVRAYFGHADFWEPI